MVRKFLLSEITWYFLSRLKIPCFIICVIGIVRVVRIIIIKVEVETIVEAGTSPISAGIPVDILCIVAKI